ncbi:MAG: hypothetical protein EGQ63_01115, partial [Clostridiales bacterium]|nr:hypothetical protein [Clostridiales bacterium]
MEMMRSLIDKNLDNVMLVLIVITLVVSVILKVDYFNFKNVFKGYMDAFRDGYGKMNGAGNHATLLYQVDDNKYVFNNYSQQLTVEANNIKDAIREV